MKKKVEKTAEIQVIDESNNRLSIDEFTTFTLFQPVNGPGEWLPGSRAYELNGEHCNQIDPNTWKTLESEKILRRT